MGRKSVVVELASVTFVLRERNPMKSILSALNEKVNWDYDEVAFIDVVDQLREEFGINVVIWINRPKTTH